jgi:hypothetical protein
MDDLWAIASEDHEGLAREAALARADAELEAVMPFLLAARTPGEFEHRASLAEDSLMAVAARNDLDLGDLMTIARRRYDLYREALAEGTDPLVSLIPLLNGGGQGAGPEEPLEHDEGPDFSNSYSEVPMGNLSGPDPAVTRPRPEAAAPVQEATGSLRRKADSDPGSMMMSPYMPPDLGTGSGSVDLGVADTAAGGLTPSIPAGSNTMPGGAVAPVGTSSRTGSRDPVRSRVLQVTAVIARANPGMPAEECERLGRKVVARYLTADLNDSAISNGPMDSGGGSGGSSGSDGHGGAVKDMLAGQGLRSMIPGLGGGAGGAGGAAADLGDVAELAL